MEHMMEPMHDSSARDTTMSAAEGRLKPSITPKRRKILYKKLTLTNQNKRKRAH